MWAQLYQKIVTFLTSDSLVLVLVLMQLLSDSISLIPSLHTPLFSTGMLLPQEQTLALSFALTMYHVVSAVFISSTFSAPLQQLDAEPGSPGRWTHAGLEIQHYSSAADSTVTTGKRKNHLLCHLQQTCLTIFKVHRGFLGLESE